MLLQFICSRLIIVYLLIIGIAPAFAAPTFIATVDTNQVMLGETLTLKLELSNTSANSEPDVSSLENMFEVYGPQQFHSTQIINGKMSSQLVWQYTLEPQKAGSLVIPSLRVKTRAGSLRSQPIKIRVSKTPVRRSDNIRLEVMVSNPNPYLYQPIIYTLRLYHYGELNNLEPMPPSDNVILEQLGKLNQRRVVIHGKQTIVAQISYILTPLRSGQLNLGMGKIRALKSDNTRNPFGNSFFGFSTNSRPTTISSKPLTLEVQPPAVQQQPWLPLQNLKLEHQWETDISKPVMAGTPLIRTLTLIAEGMGGQSSPQLDTFVQSNADFRVRTPKPETERKLLSDNKTPVSKMTQGFSLIPLNTGTLQLPAIRIPWWDVNQDKLVWAELPAQTIQVIPNQNYQTPASLMTTNSSTATSNVAEAHTEPSVATQSVSQIVTFSQTQHTLLVIAIFALLIALGQSWYSRRLHLTTTSIPDDTKPSKMSDATFKKHLESTDELAAIKQLIQEYAHLRWQTPQNASLQTIAQYLTTHYENFNQATDSLKEFNAVLYGQQTLDLTEWKKRCIESLTHKEQRKAKSEKNDELVFAPLNPVG